MSNTDEGVALRDAGIKTRILVMADFLPFTREALLAYNLTPVIHSLADLAELDRLAGQRNQRVVCHLKIDTGMGRLGVRADVAAIAPAILDAKNVEIEALMTHFASAGNYQTSQTDEQIALFEKTVAGLAQAGSNLSYCTFRARYPWLIGGAFLARHGAPGPRPLWLCFTSARTRSATSVNR